MTAAQLLWMSVSERKSPISLTDQPSMVQVLHIANGEFSGAGTRRQRERGIDDDPQRHFEDVLRLSHGKVNRERVKPLQNADAYSVPLLSMQ